MRPPKLVKRMWKYVPLLLIFGVALTVFLLRTDLHRGSSDFDSTSPLADSPQLLNIVGTLDACPLSTIYTSLPPKCRTLDGEFIPLPGASSITLIPGIK